MQNPTTTTASAQPENVLDTFKRNYMRKLETAQVYETEAQESERVNFPLSFWHKQMFPKP